MSTIVGAIATVIVSDDVEVKTGAVMGSAFGEDDWS